LIQGEGKGASQSFKKTVVDSEHVLDFYHGIAGHCLGLAVIAGSAVIAGFSLQRPGFDVGFVVDRVPLGQVSLQVCISVFHCQHHPTNIHISFICHQYYVRPSPPQSSLSSTILMPSEICF
jgi:hypothetical protein